MNTEREKQSGNRKRDERKRVATADISICSRSLSLLVYIGVLFPGNIGSEYR